MAGSSNQKFNKPMTSDELPTPAGIASMFRLPTQKTTEGITQAKNVQPQLTPGSNPRHRSSYILSRPCVNQDDSFIQ